MAAIHRAAVRPYAVPSAKVKRVEIPTGNELHKCRENLKKAQAAMDATISAIRANAHAGGLLLIAACNENPGGAWVPWLKANGISKAEARRLMNFAKLCEKGKGNHPIEMLRNFGFIPPIEKNNKPSMKGLMPQWMTWTGKLVSHLGGYSASQMDIIERMVIAQQLQPLVDFHAKLSR
jgi:hypothetical protein